MSERLRIVISPPNDDHSNLSVEDAMEQVLDAFRLLKSSSEVDDSVTWDLVSASANSPLSIEAEARSTKPGIEVDLMIRNQKKDFFKNYNTLLNGAVPELWKEGKMREVVKHFVSRNRTAIAFTSIELDENLSIELTKEKAIQAYSVLEKPEAIQKKPYSIMGSVEGVINEVGTYHKAPAIKIKERISGDLIWCLVDQDHIEQVAGETTFEDVWLSHRVIVKGTLEYDSYGKLSKVNAVDISLINVRSVDVDELKDPDFTGGLSPGEYIDRLREGNLE